MEAACHVILYHAQPRHLLLIEFHSSGLLFEHPVLEIAVHRQVVCSKHRVDICHPADQGDQSCKLFFRRVPVHLLQLLVSLPYPQRRKLRLFQFQLLQHFLYHGKSNFPALVRLVVEYPKGSYLVLVGFQILPEVPHKLISPYHSILVPFGPGDFVNVHRIDDLLMHPAHVLNVLVKLPGEC
ncbi:MAG: hypothetical protein A4E24_01992 [Methanomethylovorans sp. PtaU1.Bin093]|nr:MAG: hypothetical protein A4E24_01992 [Methanomethylovorans sp. PtaU1.Bin093]